MLRTFCWVESLSAARIRIRGERSATNRTIAYTHKICCRCFINPAFDVVPPRLDSFLHENPKNRTHTYPVKFMNDKVKQSCFIEWIKAKRRKNNSNERWKTFDKKTLCLRSYSLDLLPYKLVCIGISVQWRTWKIKSNEISLYLFLAMVRHSSFFVLA